MKQYITLGLPMFALFMTAALGVSVAMAPAAQPAQVAVVATPVQQASISEQEMQRLAVMLNEIEPQAY